MRLEEYLDQCRPRRFNWHSWNCVHFALGWVQEVEDSQVLLVHYVQSTETALAAARVAQKMGGLRNALTSVLGRDPMPALSASIGDVVMLEEWRCGSAGTLGICNGVSAVTLHPAQGFASAAMGAASCIWKINRNG